LAQSLVPEIDLLFRGQDTQRFSRYIPLLPCSTRRLKPDQEKEFFHTNAD
jgi:hypothetical protein